MSTVRLPQPGGDGNNWGSLLNAYLSVMHDADGTLKDSSVARAKLDPDVRSSLGRADLALPASQKASPSGVASLDGGGKLTSSQLPANVITRSSDSANSGKAIDAYTGAPLSIATKRRIPKGVYATLGWHNADTAVIQKEVRAIQALGAETIRINIRWADVETAQGSYTWTAYDEILNAGQLTGANILVNVETTPAWARPGGTDETHPPTSNATIASFCSALATRYKGRIMAYQIWNEPNVNINWKASGPNAAEFTAMVQACSAAIRTVDTTTKVVPGGIATEPHLSTRARGDLFVEDMITAGIVSAVNAICIHPYALNGTAPGTASGSGGNPAMHDFRSFELFYAVLKASNVTLPLWITEFGWTTTSSVRGATNEQWITGVSETLQAQYLTEAYELASSYAYIEQMLWFSNWDIWTMDTWSPDFPTWYFGLHKYDFSPKPAARAFTQLPGTGTRQQLPVVEIVDSGGKLVTNKRLRIGLNGSGGYSSITVVDA